MAKKFANTGRDKDIQSHEAQRSPSRSTQGRHILIKMSKIREEKRKV